MNPAATYNTSFIKWRLPADEWRTRMAGHEREIALLLDDYLEKREQQYKNPVMDFLFEYYPFRPSHLQRWSPGFGVLLTGTTGKNLPELSELAIYRDEAMLDPSHFPENRKESLRWILTVLENSAQKKPSFGCFGMHEWAMVYQRDRVRHEQVPLRMDKEELAAFVESRPLVCTHFDAFRFFSEPARPLNKFKLSREVFPEMEQPGCIHTNMDLYKWAFKFYPWISSDTIRSAFKLAVEARVVDMKASPYDLRHQGLNPIKIETENGRLEYLDRQREIYRRSVPVRKQLIKEYRYIADYFGC